jgi:SAM-dependent methyltransferase
MKLPTERFTDRVETYVLYRPGYPQELVELLTRECGLGPGRIVADIGSGPGNLAQRLLAEGAAVYAVEPNAAMREAGIRLLGANPHYVPIDGSAERTNLHDHSVDLVTAAQAFHWFDPKPAKVELRRILRPGGAIALIWNRRLTDTTEFLRRYEELLDRFSSEYKRVNHTNTPIERMADLVAPAPLRKEEMGYAQEFDWDGLIGRALSSSYVPLEGEANLRFVADLRDLFDREKRDGIVRFEYRTEVFFATAIPSLG